eukprot:TRINITY_DN28189_c0_g1_i1.p1 TRINITY_DN28189_c0_g1~~TRINITY_DN28189_c0_g1_i1.p1  ORF type:complete len:356 (+),score=112.59 TRINITY_DN28189_c0_g1_i1:118-1068(+)
MNTEVPISADGLVYHIHARAQDIADNVILVGDPGRVDFVASFFDAGSVRFTKQNREIRTVTGVFRGMPVTAMSTGMGCDNVEIVVTELHILKEFDVSTRTWGAKRPLNLIRCGTCGCPQEGVPAGALAVTHLGIGLDNTGRYYSDALLAKSDNGPLLQQPGVQEMTQALARVPLGSMPPYVTTAHPDITNTLEALGKRLKRDVVVGHTASGSGFYACQGRKVGRLSDIKYPDLTDQLASLSASGRKVVNIEMENSALCHISHALGYRAGTICVVVATRAGGKAAMLRDEDKVPAMTDCVTLALDTLLNLSSKQARL